MYEGERMDTYKYLPWLELLRRGPGPWNRVILMNVEGSSARMRPPRMPASRSRRFARTLVSVAAIALVVTFLVPGFFVPPSVSVTSPASVGGIQKDSCTCWMFNITETGLPLGTTWTAVYAGVHKTTNGTSLSWGAANGTYNWSVLPTSFAFGGQAWPEWAPNVSRGTVHVLAQSIDLSISFLRAWTVTFTESGLPSGTNWTTRLFAYGSTPTTDRYSTTNFFHYPLFNGTYNFEVFNIQGATGVEYVPTQANYTLVKVAGHNVSENVVYDTYYYLGTTASPPSGGTASPTSGWYASGASPQLGETPANGYRFTGWVRNGTGSYSGLASSPTITLNNPINETAMFFASTYNVTFSESGLPSGTSWSVTLNGSTEFSTTSTIVFTVINGSYAFNVSAVTGYTVQPSSGRAVVTGAAVPEAVTFMLIVGATYSVSFTETGLVPGTTWSVTLGGALESSTTATIVFTEPNGTYSYSVTSVAGYQVSPAPGNVDVSGAHGLARN